MLRFDKKIIRVINNISQAERRRKKFRNIFFLFSSLFQPQASEAPYKLILSKNQLSSDQNESIDVKIQGNGAGDTIKGFMIQARVGDKPIGKFAVKSKKHAQVLNCSGGSGVSRKKNTIITVVI